MLIVLEGVDGSGKTTIANKLANIAKKVLGELGVESIGIKILHHTKPVKFKEAVEVIELAKRHIIICDRFIYGQFAYNNEKDRELNHIMLRTLEAKMINEVGGVYCALFTASNDDIEERIKERDEEVEHDKWITIKSKFNSVISASLMHWNIIDTSCVVKADPNTLKRDRFLDKMQNIFYTVFLSSAPNVVIGLDETGEPLELKKDRIKNHKSSNTAKGIVIHTETATEAFDTLYDSLYSMNINAGSRDGDIVGEFINCTVVIDDPTKNIVESKIRKMPMRYAVGEFLWYIAGSNRTDCIEKYSKFWKKIATPEGTNVSAYGHKLGFNTTENQITKVFEELKFNKNSRRAIAMILSKDDNFEKDIPCTVSLQFFIRDNKLIMITNMRSNDIWLGFPFDVFCFTNIQVLLWMKLKDVYPELGLGSYIHNVGSMHLYKRNKQ